LGQYYKSREAVGIIVGIFTLFAVFLPNTLFVAVLLFFSYALSKELSNALNTSGYPYLSPLVLLASSFDVGIGLVLAGTFCLFVAYQRWSLEDFFKGFFILVYSGIFPSFLYQIKLLDSKHLLVLLLFVWAVDVSSYYLGKALGKTPFFPKLSPKKTWEGFWGGLIAGVFVFYLLSGKPILYGVFMVILAVMGDLFKSFIKRQVGIKDFSHTLGEHGGFVDRFDSLLFVSPFYLWVIR